MMTSWHGNTIGITGPLWGESISHRLICGFRWQRVSNAKICCFICCLNRLLNKQSMCRWCATTWSPYVVPVYHCKYLQENMSGLSFCGYHKTKVLHLVATIENTKTPHQQVSKSNKHATARDIKTTRDLSAQFGASLITTDIHSFLRTPHLHYKSSQYPWLRGD